MTRVSNSAEFIQRRKGFSKSSNAPDRCRMSGHSKVIEGNINRLKAIMRQIYGRARASQSPAVRFWSSSSG
jgi:transposase